MYTKMFDLLKMFSSLKGVLKMLVFVFENSKDGCLEIEQVTKSNLPTQISFLFIFYSFV